MEYLEIFTVPANATLLDAVEKIARNTERTVVVVDGEVVVGVISQGDIMRALLRGTDIHSLLDPFVHRSFTFLNERDPKAAFEVFKKHTITLVPVVDRDFKLRDVITLTQLFPNIHYE